ncbi:LOW QUALITY PROTEIN: probable carboxylesterase 16 [Eucalyptus grandis]|uniref:LOW QUALITY PROTEIN: probable carboxylesterase 16 n=1 Tax=Eucalyptus grandis TaxID=71139 RepID=UPI00192F1013|nr:LOW QUALITY PROTEIN: probable carboxylesterase 16 [Eucalyptus grandis]
MPTAVVKLYSLFFKYHLKHKLQALAQSASPPSPADPFGIASRLDEPAAPANPSFVDGAASKDIHIDPSSALSLRLFLPDTVLASPAGGAGPGGGSANYGGYSPSTGDCVRLPVMLQFHGGGFVNGGHNSAQNDGFCRRIARACDVIVVAVGYRLAPESKYPAAFEDGAKALNWLAKQANLAGCSRSIGKLRRNVGVEGRVFDSFGVSMVEPWLAAHGDPSRCVLLGVSSGANIAEYVCQKAVEAGKLLDPIKVVAQVLMYPFFAGSTPTKSEVKLANSYFYDKAIRNLALKLLLPDEEFSLDHPAVNPLVSRTVPLKCMPPTVMVVAEHDMMRDRAITYCAELRKFNVDAPVLDYKDAVHEFATKDMLLQTPQARACAEDIAIWVKKYISLRGLEFSY